MWPGVAVAAAAVTLLAAGSRRRARESALLAWVATALLENGEVGDELARIATRVAQALGAGQARIIAGPALPVTGDTLGYPLTAAGRRVGTIILGRCPRRGSAARRRIVPALASLLGVAIDRERLAREALAAETLRRSDAVKTAVLRAVSHDLRTPLMAILTAASALARPGLALDESDRRDLLATVLDEAYRLDHLVRNLLDVSRLEAGAAQPQPELVAAEDLVAGAIWQLGADAGRVDTCFPEAAPPVRADPQQVQRALVNLIENALKYSPPPEPVRVQVAATRSEVLVRVIDHGPRISDGDTERIFTAFQRGTEAGNVRGAGLGLAIASGFAAANGGRIWVESHHGQGATFVLAMPAEAEDAAA